MRCECVDILVPAANANAGKVESTNADTHTPTRVSANFDKSAPCRYAALRGPSSCPYGALTRNAQCIGTILFH